MTNPTNSSRAYYITGIVVLVLLLVAIFVVLLWFFLLRNRDGKNCAEDCEAQNLVCNPSTGECVECVKTLHCDENASACVDNQCVCGDTGSKCQPPAAICDLQSGTLTFHCVECEDNLDCTTPQQCDITTNTCVECFTSEDCERNYPDRPVCDTATNTCQ